MKIITILALSLLAKLVFADKLQCHTLAVGTCGDLWATYINIDTEDAQFKKDSQTSEGYQLITVNIVNKCFPSSEALEAQLPLDFVMTMDATKQMEIKIRSAVEYTPPIQASEPWIETTQKVGIGVQTMSVVHSENRWGHIKGILTCYP